MRIDADYWIEARQRIAKMRRIDRLNKLVFGSNGHKYEILDPVSEKRIHEFELRNGVELPDEYRSFLTVFGAGGAGPDYGIYDFSYVEPVSVKQPFHLTDSQEWPDDDDDPMWDLPGLLTISTSGCAIDWSIEVNGPQPGTMWVDAGPRDKLVRCDSFGVWYGKWLDRIETGLQKYTVISKLIASRATILQIIEGCGIEPTYFKRDGRTYIRFQGVPGRIRPKGDYVASFDIDTCWIK
jgi:hypothetical protein